MSKNEINSFASQVHGLQTPQVILILSVFLIVLILFFHPTHQQLSPSPI